MSKAAAPTNLKQLGQKTPLPQAPDEALLERITITDPEISRSVVQFSCPEFTSLCPVTGQPDFARIYIQFVPYKYLVESKSLKLFMGSFRNHGAFHEACTTLIFTRLKAILEPHWLRVYGFWFPRGGMPIDVFLQTGLPPSYVHIPEIKVKAFEGR